MKRPSTFGPLPASALNVAIGAFVAVLLLSLVPGGIACAGPQVRIDSGPVEGAVTRGVWTFLGVPFAAPRTDRLLDFTDVGPVVKAHFDKLRLDLLDRVYLNQAVLTER